MPLGNQVTSPQPGESSRVFSFLCVYRCDQDAAVFFEPVSEPREDVADRQTVACPNLAGIFADILSPRSSGLVEFAMDPPGRKTFCKVIVLPM